MQEYEIEVFEVQAIKYRVLAPDAASAVRAVQRGEAEYDEESTRFVRQLPCEGWLVREAGQSRATPWGVAPSHLQPRAEVASGTRLWPALRQRRT